MSKIQYQQKPNISSGEHNNQPSERKPYNNNRRSDNQYSNNHNRPANRYQDKQNRFKNKYGFDYDESKISYNTEIPQMPQKPKVKPDENKVNKKIEDLQSKVKQLKRQRKQKKDSYKNGNKQFTEQIQNQKRNIQLAKACLVVLNYDDDNLQKEINQLTSKIEHHKRKIQFLTNKGTLQRGGKNVNLEDMTYAELCRQEDRIEQEMSMRTLSKAQEQELSNKLNKIKKRKVEVPRDNTKGGRSHNVDTQKQDQIQSHRRTIDKLTNIRNTLKDKRTDIENKIESIEDNIQDFEQNIEEIHEKLRNTDNSKLLEEAAKLKQQIYDIWDEVAQLKQQQKTKLADYEYEQEKIKYIQWAKKIKAKKAETWEEQKQQRKKQKLREKEKQKKQGTKEGEKKQGETTGADQSANRPAFQRRKINRNQKQIDACAFLIQYCKDLNAGLNKTQDKSSQQKQVKLQQQLKKGQWAKMKNVEVIQSKKKKGEDEDQQAKGYNKKKEARNIAQGQSQQPTSDRFSHTYFVAQVFDSVKVLPPTKPQELQKLINQLEDKMEYYIAHPDEEVGRSLLSGKEERETKTRGARRIINTEEFPSLN